MNPNYSRRAVVDNRVSLELRKAVAEQAKGCCEYCRSQEKFSTQSFSTEHITPRSRGGGSVAGNLAFACQGCNAHKYNKIEGIDPLSKENAPLFHPRRQKWTDHFGWSSDFSLIIGFTPTGRSTVEALKLNREGLINLRKILYAAGEHPPQGEA